MQIAIPMTDIAKTGQYIVSGTLLRIEFTQYADCEILWISSILFLLPGILSTRHQDTLKVIQVYCHSVS